MPPEVETRTAADGPFRIGEWLVDPRLNRLTRGGEFIQLELKLMDVLLCLVEHAGELVERQQIVDRVWATEYICDNTLTHTIAELRNALGDDAKEPRYIETIHRRGYRLVAPVEGLKLGASNEPDIECVCKLVIGEREYYLRKDENMIGRAPEAAIHVEAKKASRHHACITVVGTLAVLEDLKRKNGTFVEGLKIEKPAPLNDGDGMAIGDTLLVFRREAGPGSTFSDEKQ